MAEKACHAFGSTTRFGLTQALARRGQIMGWRFRKSFSPFPGVRLTLSPSGISTSVGVGPFRATVGSRGPAVTANLPGTGISFRQAFPSNNRAPSTTTEPQTSPIAPPQAHVQALNDIKSAGTAALTTPGLEEFRKLLSRARAEHLNISRELASARSQEKLDVDKFTRWERGIFFRHIFKSKHLNLCARSEESTARRCELEQQENLAKIQTQIEINQRVNGAFHRMCDEFALLSKSERIWDTVGHRATNRIVERTSANRIISREPVKFSLGKCEIIDSEWTVPHLSNANGGDLYLYPAFAIYFMSSDRFALLEYTEITVTFALSAFHEEEGIPRDSSTIGKTWAKTNKDGTPDRRFKDNYQIPVTEYGKLVLGSTSGLNEEYMISNARQTDAFAKSLHQFVAAIRSAG